MLRGCSLRKARSFDHSQSESLGKQKRQNEDLNIKELTRDEIVKVQTVHFGTLANQAYTSGYTNSGKAVLMKKGQLCKEMGQAEAKLIGDQT